MIKRLFKKTLFSIKLFFYSLMYGMKNANDLLTRQGGEDNDNGIFKVINNNNVMNDLIEQNVTKEVEELREKHYRIVKEADKYDTSTIKISFDSDGNPIFSETDHLRKKTKADFMKHCDVLNEHNDVIRTIQDNRNFGHNNLHIANGVYDYDTTLTIERDGIMPRFEIEKFVTKIVVRENSKDNKRAFVDFYLPTMASQFGKIDAIFVSNLHTMFETKNFRSDILDIFSIEWVSDKAWNSDDICLFKYDDIKATEMNVYDGNFVISFDCNIVSDGEYIPEKYMTKEMDEKYESLAPKSNAVDLFAIKRRNDKIDEEKNNINLNTTTLKL